MQKAKKPVAEGRRCGMLKDTKNVKSQPTETGDKSSSVPSRIFETSWEVCNKIGGIYTVLSTKARVLQETAKDAAIFIGPDVWTDDNQSPTFKEYKSLLRGAASKMVLPMGLSIRVGRWQVPGQPLAVLVKFDSVYEHLPKIYGEMWEKYGVDSLHAYGDYPEGCAFAVAAAIVIKELTAYLGENPMDCIAHFDEWTTAMGLLYLETYAPRFATMFTTHATSIGRSICGNGKPLYDYFAGYHGDQMAQELNMESKHSLEKQAAAHADCFTTVSSVTAAECTQLLDTTPQVVTPNGFEPDFVPGEAKYNKLRKAARKHLLEIAEALTGREMPADTLLVATSGRNEYRNKGIDLYIDSLLRYADRFKDTAKPVIAFILVPAWMKEPQAALSERLNGNKDAVPENDFMTHRLNNEEHDAITCRLNQIGGNHAGRKVTFIFVPCYLDGKDGVVDISYYDLLPAFDLTIFPSYYEPWGYTPLESIAFSVPTVSSDKAGFGQWILDETDATFSTCGAEVIERNDHNYDSACDSIAEKINYMATTSDLSRAPMRAAAALTAGKADWSLFMKYYEEAFRTAMERRDERIK